MTWMHVRKKGYVELGKHRQEGVHPELINTKLHYKHGFPCKPKQKESKEAESVTFVVGLGCNFHQAHPEFFQPLSMWKGGVYFLASVARSYKWFVKRKKCFLHHLLCICYNGYCCNTSHEIKYHQNKNSLKPIKKYLLKSRPTASAREAVMPLETGKILCNFLLQANECISYIAINSNTNHILLLINSTHKDSY